MLKPALIRLIGIFIFGIALIPSINLQANAALSDSLDVSKYVSVAFDPAETIRYQVRVTNQGAEPLSNLTLQDPLPDDLTINSFSPAPPTCGFDDGTLRCDIASLAAGESFVLEVVSSAPEEIAFTTTYPAAEVCGTDGCLSSSVFTDLPGTRLDSVTDAARSTTVTPEQANAVRIMPLGDSITQGSTFQNSYRRDLWFLLQNGGYNVDFVGSLQTNHNGPAPNPDFDLDHEGHWGWRADRILGDLPAWANAALPDLVLVHLGTNDINQGQSTASTINELTQIVGVLRNANPNVIVVMAQIIPFRNNVQDVSDLNAGIANLSSLSTAQSPVYIIDQNTGFDLATMTYDDVHPNDTGEAQMADRWYQIVSQILDGSAVDVVAPALTLNGANPQLIVINDPYVEAGATALDNVDGDLTSQIVVDSSAVNTSVIGSYNVTYTVSDAAGNTANETRVVQVYDPNATRVLDDLLVLYDFEEASGDTVFDVSGVGTALDLTVESPANISRNGGTLIVNSSVRIASPSAATKLNTAIQASDEFTVEAWITPANTTQDGPARIVSYSEDKSNANFLLGQTDTVYNMRLRTEATNSGGFPSTDTPTSTATTALSHVVVTHDTSGTLRIYIDGVEVSTGTPGTDVSSWNANYRFGLANEFTDARPFLGTFHLVALYSKALSAAEVTQNFQVGPQDGFQDPPADPLAAFTCVCTGLDCALDASGSADQDENGASIASYEWDFGAGYEAPITTASTNRSFAQGGIFPVSLRVTDDEGATDTVTENCDVPGPATTPIAAFSSSVVAGLEISFDGSASTDQDESGASIVTYEWDFTDDGSYDVSSASPTTSFTYPATGTYDVRLRVTDDEGETDEAVQSVTVTLPPTASFIWTAQPGYSIDFDGSASTDQDESGASIVTYEWDFTDDGSYDVSSASPTTSFTYPALSSYDARLRVTDDEGETAEVVITVTTANFAPMTNGIASLSVAQGTASSVIDLFAAFDDGEDADADLTYLVTNNTNPTLITGTAIDGVAGTLTLTYDTNQLGTAMLTVQATDTGSLSISTSFTVEIIDPNTTRVTDSLLALYDFEEASGNTVFDVGGIGTPLDLIVETPANVSRGTGTMTVNADVRIASPSAATKLNTAIQASNAFTIEAWIAPSNTTQDGPARIIAYSNDGSDANIMLGQTDTVYNVRLRTEATNSGGFPSTDTPASTVTAALSHVVATRDAAGTLRIYVDGVEVSTGTPGTDISGWNANYRFGLANEFSTSRPFLGTFHLVAVYSKALSATEVTQNFQVGPQDGPQLADPLAAFNATPMTGLAVSFDGSASTDQDENGASIVTYEWDFTDDGNYDVSSASPTTSFTYPAAGIYDVRLRVTDDEGATAEVVQQVTVSLIIAAGDCNADGLLDSSDQDSLRLELFDGDGSAASAVAGGSFAGDPVGCDANEDSLINAADLSCAALLLNSDTCTTE